MTPDIQKANDLLAAVCRQRDAALNANANADALIASQQREIEALKAKIVELSAPPAGAVSTAEPYVGPARSNGEYSDSPVHPGVAC